MPVLDHGCCLCLRALIREGNIKNQSTTTCRILGFKIAFDVVIFAVANNAHLQLL